MVCLFKVGRFVTQSVVKRSFLILHPNWDFFSVDVFYSFPLRIVNDLLACTKIRVIKLKVTSFISTIFRLTNSLWLLIIVVFASNNILNAIIECKCMTDFLQLFWDQLTKFVYFCTIPISTNLNFPIIIWKKLMGC